MGNISVLFIDDDTMLRTLAVGVLESRGFRIFTALTTKAADDIIRNNRLDIIVCDVMMPNEDGLQYCKRLRQGNNQTPILFLSAVGQPAVIEQALSLGANGYLVKPFDIYDLEKRLRKMVGSPVRKTPSRHRTPVSEKQGWMQRLTRRLTP